MYNVYNIYIYIRHMNMYRYIHITYCVYIYSRYIYIVDIYIYSRYIYIVDIYIYSRYIYIVDIYIYSIYIVYTCAEVCLTAVVMSIVLLLIGGCRSHLRGSESPAGIPMEFL